MNTVFLLMAQFDKALIPLSEISEEYLGLKPHRAVIKYNQGELGLPVIRMRNSQKSPLVIRVQDLAKHIDELAEKAKSECLKSAV